MGVHSLQGFVPNSPASIRGEFDYDKLHAGKYTEGDFMAAMPTAFEMTTVMTVVEVRARLSLCGSEANASIRTSCSIVGNAGMVMQGPVRHQ